MYIYQMLVQGRDIFEPTREYIKFEYIKIDTKYQIMSKYIYFLHILKYFQNIFRIYENRY